MKQYEPLRVPVPAIIVLGAMILACGSGPVVTNNGGGSQPVIAQSEQIRRGELPIVMSVSDWAEFSRASDWRASDYQLLMDAEEEGPALVQTVDLGYGADHPGPRKYEEGRFTSSGAHLLTRGTFSEGGSACSDLWALDESVQDGAAPVLKRITTWAGSSTPWVDLVEFSRDGRWMTQLNSGLSVWDNEQPVIANEAKKPNYVLKGSGGNGIEGCRFSPVNNQLLTWDSAGQAKIWVLGDSEPYGYLLQDTSLPTAPASYVNQTAVARAHDKILGAHWSLDGKWIVTVGSWDANRWCNTSYRDEAYRQQTSGFEVKVWKIGTTPTLVLAKLLTSLNSITGAASYNCVLHLSPDNHLLVLQENNNLHRIELARDGASYLGKLTDQGSLVKANRVGFIADGRLVVQHLISDAGSTQFVLSVFDLSSSEPVKDCEFPRIEHDTRLNWTLRSTSLRFPWVVAQKQQGGGNTSYPVPYRCTVWQPPLSHGATRVHDTTIQWEKAAQEPSGWPVMEVKTSVEEIGPRELDLVVTARNTGDAPVYELRGMVVGGIPDGRDFINARKQVVRRALWTYDLLRSSTWINSGYLEEVREQLTDLGFKFDAEGKVDTSNVGNPPLYSPDGNDLVSKIYRDPGQFRWVAFGTVAPGTAVTRRVRFTAPEDFMPGALNAALRFSDQFGFAPADVKVSQEIKPLQLEVSREWKEINGNGDGLLQGGENGELTVTVKNAGGEALHDIEVSLDAAFSIGNHPELRIQEDTRSIKSLAPGASVTLKFGFGARNSFNHSALSNKTIGYNIRATVKKRFATFHVWDYISAGD
ncbi:MAG: hypothetical protein KDB82_09250 [Planctomycetes bacterium]|nr:hypothetical protein [Planctomycetota bacterium]